MRPDVERLSGFVDALKRGWSHDNVRGEAAARDLLELIDLNPDGFFAAADDPEGQAGDVTLPDGSKAQRLPGLYRWLWDGEFCGLIGLRWARGTAELPAHVLGHVGYSVTPWKRGRGYATRALGLMLPIARARGLPWIELTTDEQNLPSQKVILANGGRLVERFAKAAAYGGGQSVKFRIDLDSGAL
ncbi:MAG: GNAT family N-acetyltransferase [Caulobacteraceae bacterium]